MSFKNLSCNSLKDFSVQIKNSAIKDRVHTSPNLKPQSNSQFKKPNYFHKQEILRSLISFENRILQDHRHIVTEQSILKFLISEKTSKQSEDLSAGSSIVLI